MSIGGEQHRSSKFGTSNFIISLDFELLWGVRDHANKDTYGANVLGGREAIPQILKLFECNGIRATWATVGFLFAENKDELLGSLPEAQERPTYSNERLSNYQYLDEVGDNEASDPFYFGLSLVRRIAECPGQEIGSHTLSHYYCLEPGQTTAMFEADLRAGMRLAERRGIALHSIVFPRNQYGKDHLNICFRNGIKAYRGNPSSWTYRPGSASKQTFARRALRLVDAHTGILGHHTNTLERGNFRNVPASQPLRPKAGCLAGFHPLHVRVIKKGMSRAALRHEAYHLWWHPHNFGRETEENLAALEAVLTHYKRLNDAYGMKSRAMGDLV